MIKLKVASKRVRPLMGTFVEITLFSEGDFSSLLTEVFDEAAALAESREFSPIMNLASAISDLSQGAFNGDLQGIAKGYIVDCMVKKILNHEPALSGLVNAGGDLRFFNCTERLVDLRLGSVDMPVLRQFTLRKDALATSSLTRSRDDSRSSTRYDKALREGLDSNCSVSVVATECSVADALTKVGLFASRETAEKCARHYQAQIMVFDGAGELIDILGDHEAQ